MLEWFWDPAIWVPPGYTWDDLKPREGMAYPNSDHLWYYPFIFAATLLVLKYLILIPLVFNPLGRYLGIRSKPYKSPVPNDTLDRLHRQHRTRPPKDVLKQVASDLGWGERQIQRWLRQKTVSQQETTLEKFTDCAWQFCYYVLYCILGVVVLHDKPWLYDMRACWYDFPLQSIDDDVWWYIMIALGFYWSQTLTHFWQPQRKDSYQMLIHHIVTIIVITLAWICNIIRSGSLVLLVHECADIPLLAAKMFGYCGRKDIMDKLFVVFLLLWIVTRLGIYPFRIIWNSAFEAHVQVGVFYPVVYIFNTLLLTIFIIHLIWTYTIIQVIVHRFQSDHISDVRSSASEVSDQEPYPPIEKKEK